MIMSLKKLITSNRSMSHAISTILNEYDIRSAHTTACYFIFGKGMYDSLMEKDKRERNIEIGKMMKKDSSLYPKIEKLLLKWMNDFLEVNNIHTQNFIESTRDSVLLINKKPTVTKFEDGLVEFRNKEGEFTSFYRINGKLILFDNMNYSIRIKGINSNKEVIQSSVFVEKYLKPLLNTMENSVSTGVIKNLKQVAIYRDKYINATDIDIYRDLMQNNKFVIDVDGQTILSDYAIDEHSIVKINNYKTFVLPIIRSILTIK